MKSLKKLKQIVQGSKSLITDQIVNPLAQTLKPFVKPLFKPLDPFFIRCVIVIMSGLSLYYIYDLVIDRQLIPHTFVIAAGKESGESHKVSEALEESLKKRCEQRLITKILFGYCNIKIEVIDTEGTDENIAVLRGDQKSPHFSEKTKKRLKDLGVDHAHLVSAQADVATEEIVKDSETKIRKVATIHEDHFQLLVKEQTRDAKQFFLKYETSGNVASIEVPSNGGQQSSFKKIAEYFNSKQNANYKFVQANIDQNCKVKNQQDEDIKVDAVFRVRIVGNNEITNWLSCGWRLIPIPYAEAMKYRHSSFNPNKIPKGAYAGNGSQLPLNLLQPISETQRSQPIPETEIDTITVKRLLLTREDIPEWLIYEITELLNRSSQELTAALYQEAEQTKNIKEQQYIKQFIIQLITRIPELNKPDEVGSTGLTLHKGATKFYTPEDSLFYGIIKNAETISSIISIILVIISISWAINLRFKRSRKEAVDDYIQETAYLMGFVQHSQLQTQAISEFQKKFNSIHNNYSVKIEVNEISKLPPDNKELDKQQIEQLVEWVCKLKRLNEIFDDAQTDLRQEEISEESFRTFTEAYKTAKEFIEERISDCQRTIASHYINQAMGLLNKASNSSLNDLDKIRDEAARILIKPDIFSRESFRTFIETYNLVRDTF